MTIVYGKVPHPGFLDRPIAKPAGFGQDNLGKRSVKGVVWHRMIGSLWGTDQYFRLSTTGALTDYGVGVEAQDGADNDGVVIRWNNPLGYQSGWASGRVIAPYGDGQAFVNKYGIDAVNRDQASIEISGLTYDVPLSEKSRQAIAALTAYWADQYKIPWDKFPISNQDGFSFVRWHQEFTGPAEKLCPGKVVMDETPDLIKRTAAILKQYQEGTVADPAPTPPPVTDIYPLGMDDAIAKMLFGSVKGDDGKTYRYDPKGTISTMWRDHGRAAGVWPALVAVRNFDTRTYFVFADGWVLWRSGTKAYGELK